MKIRILFLILFISFSSFAQQKVSSINILWDKEIRTSDEKQFLNFQGAVFENAEVLLPTYFLRIPLKNEKNASIKIFNQKYVDVSDEFNSKTDYSKNLNSELKIINEISYSKKNKFLNVSFIPLISNGSKIEKLVSFSYQIIETDVLKSNEKQINSYVDNSVLSTGSWAKVKISQDGVYKLSFEDIQSFGLSNPENIRIYGNGGEMLSENNSDFKYDDLIENPIYMEKGSDNVFGANDYILFYGKGSNSWKFDTLDLKFEHTKNSYTAYSYYYLTTDLSVGLRINSINSEISPTHFSNSYDYYSFYENDLYNLLLSGKQWYGEYFKNTTSYDFSFDVPNIDLTGESKLTFNLLARSPVISNFKISINDILLKTVNLGLVNIASYTGTYASTQYGTILFTPTSNTIDINLEYIKTASTSTGWLDFLEINARRSLISLSDQFQFRDYGTVGTNNVTQYTISNTNSNYLIWDISNFHSPFGIYPTQNGSSTVFTSKTDSLREFIAFDKTSSLLKPIFVNMVQNQNLHSLSNIDLVIVSHPNFSNQANDLATIHTSEGLNVVSVTTDEVYNEFSSGSPDPSAIRNFMKMLYDNATVENEMPRYLLLFGDGSYDNMTTSTANTNFIPTYQSNNSLTPTSSFVSDDFFGLLDDNEGGATGDLDIGIGRLPAKSSTEATFLVNKIKNYVNPKTFGDWRNVVTFIADDEDANEHIKNTDNLAMKVDTINPIFNIEKIYFDAFKQTSVPSGSRYPDVNAAIENRMKKGALIVNYIGHGNELGLAHELILGVNDINTWTNFNTLPIFMTATCEFSRFDDYSRTSAGEYALLNPAGGGIALLTTTRLVYSSPNYVLNNNFYDFIFAKDNNGEANRLGDVMRLTKNNSGSGTNKRNFTLLGDPALKPAIPTLKVKTDTINGKSSDIINDTINALSKVNIKGHITNYEGVAQNSFNGEMIVSIYDKSTNITTLANDGGATYDFETRNNIIYKGKASVINGKFDFSFMVPKDINYTVGTGKISYYISNDLIDGSDYFNELTIGGSKDSATIDNDAPKIELYMNDSAFVYGGITDHNPIFHAKVSDINGINTVGSGIGHDITAVLDGNTSQIIVLNDNYESELNDFTQGIVKYNLSDLSNGLHNIKFKVWDNYNNSSDAYIEFLVAESSELFIDHLYNYPNPFTTKTDFYFDHNYASDEMEISIQIFSISGKLVKSIQDTINTTGFRIGPIGWDGFDDFGAKIGRGIYFYKLKVKASNGQIAEKIEKLVILK